MKFIKKSTKRGQALYESACRCYNKTLSEIYGSYSADKEYYYNECLRKFRESENAEAFGIARCGSWYFTASWYCEIDGQPVIRYETGRNSYAILLEQ